MTHAQPIGYFVHHQGRGHAERAASIANVLAAKRPVTLFCAREDIFPDLAPSVEVIAIPSPQDISFLPFTFAEAWSKMSQDRPKTGPRRFKTGHR